MSGPACDSGRFSAFLSLFLTASSGTSGAPRVSSSFISIVVQLAADQARQVCLAMFVYNKNSKMRAVLL